MSGAVEAAEGVRRFRPYQEYAETGLSWLPQVPKHWRVTRLKNAAEVQTSNVDRHTVDGEKAAQLCNYTDVYYHDRISSGLDFMKASASADEIRKFTLAVGDVLITKDSETPDDIAIPAYVEEDLNGVLCGYHLALVRPNRAKFLGDFVARGFVAEGVRGQFRITANGITRFGLSISAIANSVFPAPPVDEQRAIAAFLDRETGKIDALVAKKERLIELLQEKRTAVITHAVTKGLDPTAPTKPSGIDWLGDIPAHWDIRRLAVLSNKITNGYVGPTRNILVDQGVRYLQSLHIKDGRILFERGPYYVTEEWSGAHAKSILREGDVLIVQTGAEVGQCSAVPSEFEGVNCHALIIVSPISDVCVGEYLSLVLRSDYGAQSLRLVETGALHPHHNCTHVREVIAPLPPREEQARIVQRVHDVTARIDALSQKVSEAIIKLREYRTALISAAVTGKIDVREEAT